MYAVLNWHGDCVAVKESQDAAAREACKVAASTGHTAAVYERRAPGIATPGRWRETITPEIAQECLLNA